MPRVIPRRIQALILLLAGLAQPAWALAHAAHHLHDGTHATEVLDPLGWSGGESSMATLGDSHSHDHPIDHCVLFRHSLPDPGSAGLCDGELSAPPLLVPTLKYPHWIDSSGAFRGFSPHARPRSPPLH